LDAGCGIGGYSFELAAKYGCLVVGIDIDNEDFHFQIICSIKSLFLMLSKAYLMTRKC